ncbi:MAG: class I SAM-dependent methyltransferase [candidate division Zixibacteria bacterium]|nr:class I SAM-dependent methyltransferase [candidate division Zixibacteria bacterium]
MSVATEPKYDYEKEGTFSERFPVLYNEDQRNKKAEKVIAVCRDFADKPLDQLVALDLGASTSIMTEYFAGHFKRVIALDVDDVGLKSGKKQTSASNIDYVCSDGTKSGLVDGSVDVIICNQVYEHVEDQHGLAFEIERLLSPNGFCYFGAGNRFVLIEGHYFLPFLSWMPLWASHLYLKLMGRKVKYDVFLLSLRNLRKLLKNFEMIDYTEKLIDDPKKYTADDVIQPGSFLSRMPRWLFRKIIFPILPAWVFVVRPKRM